MIRLNTDISLTVGDIAKTLKQYREQNSRDADLGTVLRMPVEIVIEDELAGIIRSYNFSQYDGMEYNLAFSELLKRGEKHQGSIIYDFSIFRRYSRIINRFLDKVPETTLQIGPGGSLGCEVLFTMMGVKRAYTLDPYPLLGFDIDVFMGALQSLFHILSFIRLVAGLEKLPLIPEYQSQGTGEYRIGENMVKHFDNRTFEKTGFQAEDVEFLFSHATFEHVRSPMDCIREIHRVLSPGGVTAHCIDLRDHRDFERPLDFLRYSWEEWEDVMQEYCKSVPHGYMNRWRASEYIAAFKEAGFEILEARAEMRLDEAVLESQVRSFDRKYLSFSKDDLAVATLFIVARKSRGTGGVA